MWLSIFAISLGAALGALARWLLSLWLNSFYFIVPLGTLSANLMGGYLIGIALGVFTTYSDLPPEWRLLTVTGFLGGLTTFSTFSAEVVHLIQEERLGWAATTLALHVVGSVLMTCLGLATFALFRRI